MKHSFVFCAEWRNAIDILSPSIRAEVCLAVVDYALTGACPTLTGEAEHAFRFVKEMVDAKFAVSDKRREAGLKGLSSRYGKKFCYSKTVAKPDFAIANKTVAKPDFAIANRSKTEICYSKTVAKPDFAIAKPENRKEEKNGKEETSFLSPTPPIYPKEEKEKKEEPPHVPQNSQAEADEAEKLTLVPSESELPAAPKKNPLDPASLPPGFVAFWNAYPSKRRADKRGCLKKWKDNGLEAQAADIVADVRKRAASDDWTRDGFKFVPLSITYLNQTRWDCAEIPQTAAFGGKPDSPVVEKLSPDEICRRRREAYFAEERRRNMLIYGKDAYKNADDFDEFGETF